MFVLTHDPRKSFARAGTTFHVGTDGPLAAFDRAKTSAKGKDIRIGGGVSTIWEYLQAGLIDEMHPGVSPVVTGKGEHLLRGIDLVTLGRKIVQLIPVEAASHSLLSI